MPTKTGESMPGHEKRQPTEWRRETTNLAGRYGEIGIPAVAAALRYTDAGKNPADAPVAPRIDLRFVEMAA